MKILIVLDTFYPVIDGPINVIANLATIINKNKWAEVELLVPKFKEKVELEGVKIHRCSSIRAMEGYRAGMPIFDRSIKKLIKNGGFDIVHVHSPFTLGKYAVKMAKKYKIPSIVTMHTAYKDDFRRILHFKPLEWFMMKYIMGCINKANFVTTVSNGASEMLRDYGCKTPEITVLRNGTDMTPTKVSKEEIEEIRKEYNLENDFVFLFVGRVVENKNIQFSLNVMSKLKQSGAKNFKFLIVGSGSYEDELKKTVKKLNIEDCVVFAGRISDRKKLAKIYASSDLFMFPSTFDTCGIVAIEAAVNGLFSAMLENCCASEVITHLNNGLSLPNDIEIWKDEILKIMQNKDKIAELKKNAFNTIYISWEDITKQYVEYYKKVLQQSKK